jgi:hypothetical protein
VEAETCSDTVTITTPIKNILVAIAGILSERFLRVIVFITCTAYSSLRLVLR